MSIQTITVHAFEQEIVWLFDVVNDYLRDSGWKLGAHRLEVPCRPRRVGSWVVPYYFGGDLRMLYEFARGEREATRDFVEDTIESVMSLLFSSPFSRHQEAVAEPDWAFLKSRPLGVMLLAARARSRLNDGEWITFDQLKSLTGVRKSRLERLGIEVRGDDDALECEPESVRKVLRRLEQDD